VGYGEGPLTIYTILVTAGELKGQVICRRFVKFDESEELGKDVQQGQRSDRRKGGRREDDRRMGGRYHGAIEG